MPGKALVAVVDDDESIRETTKDLLESAGFSAATFATAESLLRSKLLNHVCCLIADLRMPGMTGLELYRHLVASKRRIPVILISAYADERVWAQAVRADVVCCLAKPFAAEELLACVRAAILRG